MSSELDDTQGKKPERSQARVVAGGIAIGLFLLLAVVNFDKVEVDWVFGSAETPLVIVIAISFVLGAATGALIMRGRRD